MNLLEKLVSYRINKESVLFQTSSAKEKKDVLKTLTGLGFEKEMMYDVMERMNTALFIALVGGLVITIYCVPPPDETAVIWDEFEFECY